MPVPDIPTFLAKLKQSRLLDEPQLEQVEVCAAAESDPKELAKRLLRDGILTKWQAIQLLSGRSSLGLGPYRFLEQLDSDEETLCFSARKIGSERKLLVRVLPPDKAPSKAHLVRFLNRTQQIATQPGHELVDSHTAKGGSDYSYAVIAISQVKEGEIPPKATAAVPLAAAAPPRKKPPRESDGEGPPSGSSTADTPTADTPAADTPAADTPAADTPAADTPAADSPAADSPAAEVPKIVPHAPGKSADPRPKHASSDSGPITVALPDEPDEAESHGAERDSAAIAIDVIPDKRIAQPRDGASATHRAGKKAARTANAARGDRAGATGRSAGLSKQTLIVGGAVVGGLILTAVVIGALVTTFGGDRTDMAQSGPSDNQPPATRNEPDPPDENDAESGVSDVESAVEIPVVGDTTPPDPDPDTSMTEPPEASGSEDPPTPATLPAGPERAGSEPEDMTGTPGTDPAANGDSGGAALPGGDSDVEPSSNAGEDTSSPTTEDGGATDSASAASTSDADSNDGGEPGSGGTPSETSDETETDPPAADESTPGNDAEKAAKKPASKPAKKPFQDLPARAVLPAPETADGQQPIRLGAVHIPEKEFCFVKLRGGETAMRGDGEFLLRNAENGSAERDWEIFVRERDQQMLVARLSIAENADLMFRWEPAANELESTAYLVNCPLSFTCDEQSQVLSFREPTVVEALAVDLNKPALRENWTIDAAPDPAAVRVEILGLEGAEFAVEPAAILLAEDGEAWIRIQDGGGVLSLRAQTDFGRSLQLNLMAFVTYPGETEPTPLNRKQIQQARDQLATMERMVTMQVEQLRQASKAKLEKQQKNLITSRLATFEMELTKVQAGVATIRGLEEMLQRLGGSLRLKLRVYAEAGASQVDLLKIGG